MLSPSMEEVIVFLGINMILSMAMYVIFSSGQLSLGHGAFMSIGAYVSAILTMKFGQPLIIGILAGAAGAMVVGVLLSFPALRLRGLYLAVATFGMMEIVRVFFKNMEFVGAENGMSGMTGTTIALVYATALIIFLILLRLENSRLGWAILAISEDEDAAATMGHDVTYIKVLTFGISAAVAAAGGALYAHRIYFIEPDFFGFEQSLVMATYALVGGVQTVWGAALGAVILTAIPELTRGFMEWRMAIYGVLVVAMMIWRPQGLLSRETIMRIKGVLVTGRKAHPRETSEEEVKTQGVVKG